MIDAHFMSNLDAVAELVGTLQGIKEGVDSEAYLEKIIKRAHGHAADAFDVMTAATARAGVLTHVYEYGTPGITPGQPEHPDPTAEDARLWVHTLTGHGGSQVAGYYFRPALTRNPRPSTATTGVPSAYLRRMSRRKYIFWNRANVLENNIPVTMTGGTTYRGPGLAFVPFKGENSEDPKEERGYMMYPTLKAPREIVPGKGVKYKFAPHWEAYWSGAGEKEVVRRMRDTVNRNIREAMAKGGKRAQNTKLKPVTRVNMISVASRSRAITEAEWQKEIDVGD